MKYTIVSSTDCSYGTIYGGDNSEKTVSITVTGSHPTITVTAETAAPSPNDTLSNGSGEMGPNAHGRIRTTTINL